ncbi:MAG TPA: tetratricopeptide repeat protein [Pirellulales bacterium]
MTRSWRSLLWPGAALTLALVVSIGKESNATEPAKVHSKVLVVRNPTDLLSYDEGRLTVTEHLPHASILQVLIPAVPIREAANGDFQFVSLVRNGVRPQGWVKTGDLVDPAPMLASWSAQISSQPSVPYGEDGLPVLVKLSPENVRQAWIAVQQTVIENNKLPNPSPAPYFARAEIWAAVHDHEAAMRDYLQAAKLTLESGNENDLVAFSRGFQQLYSALIKLNDQPKPIYPGLASGHYSAGYHLFFGGGPLSAALKEFDDAVRLDPRSPLYRYYRALAYRRLGNDREALRDARTAAYLESRDRKRLRTTSVARALYRIQGADRRWLEAVRLGDPHYDPRRDPSLPSELRP